MIIIYNNLPKTYDAEICSFIGNEKKRCTFKMTKSIVKVDKHLNNFY